MILKQQLLREFSALDLQRSNTLLTESERVSGDLILAGIMQAADTLNGNGRIYPRDILAREAENYMKLVRENRATGELDHPDRAVVNLENVSHIVTEMWWDEDNPKLLMGKIRVLNTPKGQILRGLIEGNVVVGISSRGVGSVRRRHDNALMVEDDFGLICFDVVSAPSTTGAFMLKEALDYEYVKVFSREDRMNRLLNELKTFYN